MNRKLWLVLAMSLPMPVLATAQSTFEGTWKIDLNKVQLPTKPDQYLLQDGMYHCTTCVPPIAIKADGQDQKVTGYPYFSTMSVTVVDDRTIEVTNKKDGKPVTTEKSTVSPDGGSLTFEFTDRSATNADPVTGKGEAKRVAKGAAGSHAISGSWRTAKFESISNNGLTFSYKIAGDRLTMTNPTGQGYTAKLDGTEAPFTGDPGTTSVQLKRLDDGTLEETNKRDGKVISVSRMTLAPGGKTMTIAVDDKLHGTTLQFVAERQ